MLAWHLGATWGLRRSVRPDARVGKGSQHGAVSPAGWHFDKGSPRLAGLADRLRGAADYEAQRTAWVWGGDLRTLLPYLLFRPPAVPYKRRWLRVPIADAPGTEQSPLCGANGKTEPAARFEAVALDVAEPPGGHDPKHPVLLVLAGLTGGDNQHAILFGSLVCSFGSFGSFSLSFPFLARRTFLTSFSRLSQVQQYREETKLGIKKHRSLLLSFFAVRWCFPLRARPSQCRLLVLLRTAHREQRRVHSGLGCSGT